MTPCIHINMVYTEKININSGAKQNVSTYPLLLSLFINDLIRFTNNM